jgi:alkylation response protein AidB-like acyl-CoA dehydrogenase
MVGDEGKGFGYISEALDLERFTMFTFSPILARFELLVNYVKTATKDGDPRKNDPVVRKEVANLATQHEVARVLGLRFVAAAKEVGAKPPTLEASQYKLYATQLSQRSVNKALDITGNDGQFRLDDAHAPEGGRFDSAYRATVVETIGGGSSEIQKNIIARRGLGLPKNF